MICFWLVSIQLSIVILAVTVLTRYISLGTMVGALASLLVAVLVIDDALLLRLTLMTAGLVILRHIPSIVRIFRHTEPRLSYEKDKMTYSWLTESTTGRIKMANIIYTPRQGGNTQLNWDYRSFAMLGRKAFPDDMSITLTTPDKEVKLGVRLNYLNTDSDWETRTQVSSKYSEVDVDEILRRFMAL